MGKPIEEIVYDWNIDEIEDEEDIEKEVYLNEIKYNHEQKKVDLGHQTCTEQKTSRRVIFPPGRSPKEATIEVRMEMRRGIVDKYIKENCKEGGTQKVE